MRALRGTANAARSELNRHWFVILVACIGIACGPQGIVNLSFGVFITPLSTAFGWSQSAVAAWLGFCSLGKSISDPLVGWLSDRWSPLPVILVGIILTSTVLAFGPAVIVHGLMWFYAVGFLVGGFGAAVGHLPYSKLVISRFRLARGTALGIAMAGIGIATIVGPVLGQRIIDASSWRMGFAFLSGFGLLALPFVLLLMRAPARRIKSAEVHLETGHSLAIALRSSVFWVLCIAFFLLALALATTANLVPFLTKSGISRAHATLAMSGLGVLSITGRIVTGFVIDRAPVTVVMTSLLSLQAFVFFLLSAYQGPVALLIVPIIGLCLGGEVASSGYCMAHFFGTRSYGRVAGILGVAMAAGSGLGPYLFSRIYEAEGSYRVAFEVFAALLMLSATLFLLAGRFPKFEVPLPAEGEGAVQAR